MDRQVALGDKYVVFKKEDFDALLDTVSAGPDFLSAALPGDSFFVIRQGDVFATGGLHGYATNILSVVSTLHQLPIEGPAVISEADAERFYALSEDVSSLAMKWETEPVKFPD